MDTCQEIIKDRLGHITVYEYDTKGNVVGKTDPLGNVTTYTYDATGRRTYVTDPLGNTTTLTYEEFDSPSDITLDSSGNVYVANRNNSLI